MILTSRTAPYSVEGVEEVNVDFTDHTMREQAIQFSLHERHEYTVDQAILTLEVPLNHTAGDGPDRIALGQCLPVGFVCRLFAGR